MKVAFTKMSGAGNDFIVIDRRGEKGPFDGARHAPLLCDRRRGVGADGLILIETSPQHDFSMRYFNADGSTGSMCGNGGRCAASLVMGTAPDASTTFDTLGGVFHASNTPRGVRLTLNDPGEPRMGIRLDIPGVDTTGHFIDTGSPHLVIRVDTPEFDTMNIHDSGRKIRNSHYFSPGGTNVDYIMAAGEGHIKIRTYERGVEEETLACGTGAVASAVIFDLLSGNVEKPGKREIRVTPRSGEELLVTFTRVKGKVTDVLLEGPALATFTGSFETPVSG